MENQYNRQRQLPTTTMLLSSMLLFFFGMSAAVPAHGQPAAAATADASPARQSAAPLTGAEKAVRAGEKQDSASLKKSGQPRRSEAEGKEGTDVGEGRRRTRPAIPIAPTKSRGLRDPGNEKSAAAKKDSKTKKDDTGFAFGSYGRVGAATDGHGATTRPINVVSHGTRLEEATYLELDLYYKMRPWKGVVLQTVTTLGFKDDLFHYSGDWSSALALRNLYLEAKGLFHPGLTLWVGSRYYRGDDIYLLDYWPLDNLNTVGLGASFRYKNTWIAWHGGVNRLRDKYQYQVVAVPGLHNTSEDVVLLDRQKFITSLKAEQTFGGRGGALGFKVKAYTELHLMGSGTLNAHLDESKQTELPAEQGWLIGAQFGMWNFGQRATHANLFIRYAQGLAAYGEMAIPWGLDNARSTGSAKEFLTALSFNYEWRMLGVMAGGYLRYFKDADVNTYDWDDGWEYIFAVRPMVHLHKHFAQAVEVSYGGRWPFGLEPRTDAVQRPAITKLSLIPTITSGRSSYDRPQVRLVYTVAFLNKGARLIYNPADPRADRKIQHYVGIQAEWWYNSTYR